MRFSQDLPSSLLLVNQRNDLNCNLGLYKSPKLCRVVFHLPFFLTVQSTQELHRDILHLLFFPTLQLTQQLCRVFLHLPFFPTLQYSQKLHKTVNQVCLLTYSTLTQKTMQTWLPLFLLSHSTIKLEITQLCLVLGTLPGLYNFDQHLLQPNLVFLWKTAHIFLPVPPVAYTVFPRETT